MPCAGAGERATAPVCARSWIVRCAACSGVTESLEQAHRPFAAGQASGLPLCGGRVRSKGLSRVAHAQEDVAGAEWRRVGRRRARQRVSRLARGLDTERALRSHGEP